MLTSFKKANGYELPAEPSDKDKKKDGNSKLAKAKKAGNPSFKKAKDVNMKDAQPLFTQRGIDAMSQKEYEDQEDAIDDAMSKGLIAP